VSVTPPVKIRIIRRGSGQVVVHPPLAVLTAGETFRMVNTTREPATVSFDGDVIRPPRQTIEPKRPSEVFTAGAGPDYVEYDVELQTFRAEGNSRPGVIIDP
jgi:hypothetical protein